MVSLRDQSPRRARLQNRTKMTDPVLARALAEILSSRSDCGLSLAQG